MKPTIDHPPSRASLLALVFAALAGPGCADTSNPVLPSTGGPGGLAAGVGSDGGTPGDDTAAASDVQVAAGDDTTSSTCSNTCDLIKQDCSCRAFGCYPVSGAGRCLPAGGTGVLGTCLLGEDPPSCAPGLTCIALTSTSNIGNCLYLCDPTVPVTSCGIGNLCQQPLPGFSKASNVGYCQPA